MAEGEELRQIHLPSVRRLLITTDAIAAKITFTNTKDVGPMQKRPLGAMSLNSSAKVVYAADVCLQHEANVDI